jgi:predicted RNA polymerase sigma factor
VVRPDLCGEAIRLGRLVHVLLPDDAEAAGLLALMLLHDARAAARVVDGRPVALGDQDRALWDRDRIAEGTHVLEAALRERRPGPYQLQAAIAALHDEAPRVEETDWPQILGLYRLLEVVAPNPMVTLNRVVALSMVEGPRAGLAALADLERDERMARHHRLHAVRAHLLEREGAVEEARESYRVAARTTTSLPERRYLQARASAAGSSSGRR